MIMMILVYSTGLFKASHAYSSSYLLNVVSVCYHSDDSLEKLIAPPASSRAFSTPIKVRIEQSLVSPSPSLSSTHRMMPVRDSRLLSR